jgi:heme exporter protein CcmD
MGGYGLYVWGAFAVTGITFAAELLQLMARRRQASQTMQDGAQVDHETT